MCTSCVSDVECSKQKPFNPRFYAFHNGLGFGSYENEVKVLKEIGYDGVSSAYKGGKDLSKRIAIYEKAGLHVSSVYLDIGKGPISLNTLKPFKNKKALLELTVKKMTSHTIEDIRKTVVLSKKLNIKVALYPHHGFAVQKISEALDIIAKVKHQNLGIIFNLCHFLKSENHKDLEATIKKIKPHLFAVSTSGADIGAKNWKGLIKTLDQGSFDQKRLFKALKDIQFKGPVGLQCYAIRGDKKTNLEKSFKAWKTILNGLNSND